MAVFKVLQRCLPHRLRRPRVAHGGGVDVRNPRWVVVSLRPLQTSAVAASYDAHVVRSKYADVVLSHESYFHHVWANVDKHGDKLALVDGITDTSITYAEAYARSKNFALNLQSLGAKKNDVLAVFLPNCIEYPLIFSGATAVGVTLTTLNPIYTAPEVSKQLKAAQASWAVTTQELLPRLTEAAITYDSSVNWKDRILVVGENKSGHRSADDLLLNKASGEPDVPIDVYEDVCVLPFSSGTTGVPKGVMLTHHNLVANVCQGMLGPPEIALLPEATDEYQAVTVTVLPFFHLFAMNITMTPTLWGGGKMVVMPKFDPKTLARAIAKYRPTFMHVAPPLASFIATDPNVTYEHVTQLEHIVVGAAPSGPELIKKEQS